MYIKMFNEIERKSFEKYQDGLINEEEYFCQLHLWITDFLEKRKDRYNEKIDMIEDVLGY